MPTARPALIGDEIAGRLRLPFSFAFYGEELRRRSSSPRTATSTSSQPETGNFIPTAIPAAGAPNAAIYALLDGPLHHRRRQHRFAAVGSAPNRAFVIEYTDVRVLGSAALLDFEVKLWENGTIDLLYGSNPANPGDGRLATVGIENATGTDALQIGFFEGNLESNHAIRITTRPDRVRRRHGDRRATTASRSSGARIDGHARWPVTRRPARTGPTSSGCSVARTRSPRRPTCTRTGPRPRPSPTASTVDPRLQPPRADGRGRYDRDRRERRLRRHHDQTHHPVQRRLDAARLGRARSANQGVVLPPLPEPGIAVTRAPTWHRQPLPKAFPHVARHQPRVGAA